MKKLSILQRIAAETPPFWRGIQLICLVIAFIIDHLAQKGFVAANVQLILDGALGGIAFIALFAANNTSEVRELLNDPGAALSLLPGLAAQVARLLEAVENPPVATLDSIAQFSSTDNRPSTENITTRVSVSPAEITENPKQGTINPDQQ